MKTYVALLRGINVGGRTALSMGSLVSILEGLGLVNVRTYIRSGNAVFDTRATSAARLAGRIRSAVAERAGFEPAVLLLDAAGLDEVMAGNPFRDAEREPKTLHVGFLASVPKAPDLDGLERLRSGEERFRLRGRAFYLHAPAGVGRSKLAARAEKLLGVPKTDRNWRTVVTLRELLEAGDR